jgi:hypothetical protein
MTKKAWAALAVAALIIPACKSAGWENQDALGAEKLEMQLTEHGKTVEIEYHITPDEVPAAVRLAMDQLHPGGAYTGAEKEWNEGTLYYELTRTVQGMDVEAMFRPDGSLYQEEVQVAEGRVPEVVRSAALASLKGAEVDKWEEIRDSTSSVFEYHVKMRRGGKRYKVMVGTDGTVLGVYREIPAEVEVKQG